MPTPITIQKVNAFQDAPPHKDEATTPNASQVELNCPKEILQQFRTMMDGSPILGREYTNPYSGKQESFPEMAEDLTARHLQILARNESVNTTGEMKTGLYQGALNPNQIAKLRVLVKGTNVAGIAYAQKTGGYPRQIGGHPNPAKELDPPQKFIAIDQSGPTMARYLE